MTFPNEFAWGSATASYQIEGAMTEDGKGLSVWDAFCRKPGNIMNGDTGRYACDHYHRLDEDVGIMAEIGIQAYRFSVSWPRVLPEGVGAVNRKGLAFYDRLIDRLLENGISPWLTIFHWDFPYALYQRGGWLNRDSANWFADYTGVLVNALSDRVTHWIPLNEPQCFVNLGHYEGTHAPGVELDAASLLTVAHHVLLAHGKAVEVIRAKAVASPIIGTANVGVVTLPESNSPEEIAAARAATVSIRKRNCWNNTWFADPMFFGSYPEDGLRLFEAELPDIQDGDMEIIGSPIDFCGLNIYQGDYLSGRMPAGYPLTSMDWNVTPNALYWGPRFMYERYGKPIVITENGMAGNDWVHLDGRVHDPGRIDFMQRYLESLERAVADGVDCRGYFHWSLMDNFEWGFGYNRRFGLVHVDYQTQKRTLKDSAKWYKQWLAQPNPEKTV
jgi:beta-glucosidase